MAPWFAGGAARAPGWPKRHWGSAEEQHLLRRLGYADGALLASLQSVAVTEERGRAVQVSYAFEPLEVLYGDVESRLDEQRQLVLTITPAEEGFEQALAASSEQSGRAFLLLLRERGGRTRETPFFAGWRASLWPPLPGPRREHLWSLYHPEPELLVFVRLLFRHLDEHGD